MTPHRLRSISMCVAIDGKLSSVMRASLHTATVPAFAEEGRGMATANGHAFSRGRCSTGTLLCMRSSAPTCGTWRRAQLAHSNEESKLRSGTLTVLISVRRFEKH